MLLFDSATLAGLGAIALWSALALMTAASGVIPPFQLAAMTFAIGGGLGAASWAVRPGAMAALWQPAPVWLLGIGGLFGYHALYFAALRLAPPADAGLIAYLWPLLIVLFSALLPGEGLRARHVVGAVAGLAGVVLLVAGKREAEERTVSIRRLGSNDQTVMPLDAALAMLTGEAVPPDVRRTREAGGRVAA